MDKNGPSRAMVASTIAASVAAFLVASRCAFEQTNTDETPKTQLSQGVTQDTVVTFTQLKADIFIPYCAGCHPPNVFDVKSYTDVSARVSAGDAANSLLYKRVTTQPPIMPTGGSLTTSEKQAIANWINAGAQNN